VVYLPKGCDWIELATSQRGSGGAKLTVIGLPGEVPLFVRNNTLLPWAEPVSHVAKDTVFDLTIKVFGDHPETFTLVEDDGESFDYERGVQNRLTLSWAGTSGGTVKKEGGFIGSRYRINRWEKVTTRE
jgi:alpha-D-xyloside xylohydrolase